MAHQLEQLLTCCICLDRFRNPKLLPCQHSVCMEPCMEGLVDYVRRQVKCPECRAEHRIPYNGVQGFPSNVTLQRFLEAHIEITGETPDPFTGQYMERCAVCNEKSYLSTCAHCEKKICVDCKSAHGEILKREIGRINNQVKRATHRLNDQLSHVERNITSLKNNTECVTDEIENISKRFQKAIRDRCDFLKSEVENYYNSELRNMITLKEGLDQEISNIDANIELAEKHMDDNTPWDDCELMDTKDIFLRTMEFIRSFDYEVGDCNRRARFVPPDDLNKIASTLSTLGELVIHQSKPVNDGYIAPSLGPALMKSKSDHRLAAQFRDQEESFPYGTSGRTSPMMRRRFGERPVEGHDDTTTAVDGSRRRFKSRFMRKEDEEEKSVRFSEDDGPKQRQRVIDTEDVSRGPLSGITRLYDSPRVMKRLQEREVNAKKKKEEPPKLVTPKPTVPTFQQKTMRQKSNEDEIDKIKKQNKATEASQSPSNSASASATSGVAVSQSSTYSTSKPSMERLASLKEDERQSRSSADRSSVSPRDSVTHSPTSSFSHDEDASTTNRRREYGGARTDYNSGASASGGSGGSSTPVRKTSVDTGILSVSQRSYPYSRSSSNSSVNENKPSGVRSPRTLDTSTFERHLSRSNSTDSNKSADGASSPKKSTGAAFSTDELRSRFSRNDTLPSSSTSKSSTSTHTPATGTRFQSRFLGRAGTPSAEVSKESGNEDEEEETSEESESEESEESSEDEKAEKNEPSPTDIGPLLGRSAQARESTSSYRHSWDDKPSYTIVPPGTNDHGGSKYGTKVDTSSSSTSRYGTSTPSPTTSAADTGSSYRRSSILDTSTKKTESPKEKEDDTDSRYPYASRYVSRTRAAAAAAAEDEAKPSSFHSRFLNRSKSSAIVPEPVDDDSGTASMGSSRARFEELKERRQRLAKSKSSAGMEEEDSPASPTDTTSSSSYRPRYGKDSDSTSTSLPATAAATSASDDSTQPMSNWARYLKNKYGNRTGTSTTTAPSTSTSGISSSAGLSSGSSASSGASALSSSSALSSARTTSGRPISRSRSSHLLGLAKEGDSSEDDSKNVHATPTSPQADTPAHTTIGSIPRSQYSQKQRLLFKIGSRGSEPGNFTWPRGIAVGQDSSIVVADSSNHRVQVFDQNGNFMKEFGSYGSGEGEFDCLAGVAVNRIGQYIIADRYNHRVQVFDASGAFIRSFGSQGSGEGKFSYPWGVTTDSLGFIYVCDKENHRIQVFQSDGTFVGKFGVIGIRPGQLEHPHYIAVSSTNRVIVSDSNNHRIQMFDINGKMTNAFGSEGSEEGQFKFPRGVAIDEKGYIFVADSGNNRIQIFHPDGQFLRAFGCWGSGDGEFKGLEGVAVMPNGNILVCDRENHRIQVF